MSPRSTNITKKYVVISLLLWCHPVFFGDISQAAILYFNSLPNDEIPDMTKWKAFADNKLKVA